jgi:hypothetical protein
MKFSRIIVVRIKSYYYKKFVIMIMMMAVSYFYKRIFYRIMIRVRSYFNKHIIVGDWSIDALALNDVLRLNVADKCAWFQPIPWLWSSILCKN